jgi:tetratricopeptide (TPR) repeat protein
MNVHTFEDLVEVELLRDNWENLCTIDPAANFFLSWTWIYGCLSFQHSAGLPWLVLAAKQTDDASDYIAFFPVTFFTQDDAEIGLYTQVGMSGIADSHYPGFLCAPGYDVDAAIAFIQYLQKNEIWSVFELQHMPRSSLKLQALLGGCSQEYFKVVDSHNRIYRNELDTVDNSICPYIDLPGSWPDYLQGLGTSTRKTMRKKLKQFSQRVEAGDDYKVTHVNSSSIATDLHALLDLWQHNWRSRKGPQQCAQIAKSWAFLLHHCFEQGCLFLPILWCEDRPVGAIAHFIDRPNRALLSYVSARDEAFTDFPPGLILHAEAIRYGIENGFRVYDFLMGNEAYKYSFNVQERQITSVQVHRRDWVHQQLLISPRSVAEAVVIADRYRREGHLEAAEQRYRQILAVEPNYGDVLYSLAVVHQRQGKYAAAEEQFKELLTQRPAQAQIWFSLGTLYQQQGRLAAAVEAYRQALGVMPEADNTVLALHLNLGYALQQQGDLEMASAHFQQARALDANCAEAEAMWANVRYAQGALTAPETEHYGAFNLELGHRRQQAGDVGASIDYYRQAIAMCPDWAQAHYSLGVALEQSADNHWAEIVACYQRAQALAPEVDEIRASLAHALFVQGQLPEGERLDSAMLNHVLGDRCRQQADWKTAAHYYRRAIAFHPAWPEAHCDLGLALQKAGTTAGLDEAAACYRHAQSLAPHSRQAEVGLANVRFAKASLPAEQLTTYAQLNGDLGHHYRQMGDLALAIDHYRQALAMAPELSQVRDSLLLVLQEGGEVAIKVSVGKSAR